MPCLGVTYDFGIIASVVMPLCPEGNINDYVRDHPHANKLDLVGFHPDLFTVLLLISRAVIPSCQRRCLSTLKGRCTWEDLRGESRRSVFEVLHPFNRHFRKILWSHQTVALLSRTLVSPKSSKRRRVSFLGPSPPNISDGRLLKPLGPISTTYTRRAATCGLSV